MIDPIQVLYTYAQEQMVSALLAREEGYARAQQRGEENKRVLLAIVGEEYGERLESMEDEQNELFYFYGRALFRAGFQVALELTR